MDINKETEYILNKLNNKDDLENKAVEVIVNDFRSGRVMENEYFHEYHKEPVGIDEYEISGGWDYGTLEGRLLGEVESIIETSLEGTYTEEEEREIIENPFFQQKLEELTKRINFNKLAEEVIEDVESMFGCRY